MVLYTFHHMSKLQSYHRMWHNITRILHHRYDTNARIQRDIQ